MWPTGGKPQTTEEEFSKTYDELSDAIFRHCFLKLSDRDLAKDITQDTFKKTWSYLVDGKKIENMRAFLYKTAGNLVIDEYRKKKPLPLDKLMDEDEISLDKLNLSVDYRGQIESTIEVRRISEIIQNLDPKYKEAVIMRHIDGFSVKEIAQILEDTENNVSVKIHRGLSQIRKILEPEKK